MTETSATVISPPSALARRVAITLFLLAVARIPVAIPLPALDPSQLPSAMPVALPMRFSAGALGLTPYVTAWIIVHLFHAFMPFGDGVNRGKTARLERMVRYLTLPFALLQGIAIGVALGQFHAAGRSFVADNATALPLTTGITCAAAVFFLIWLGDKITRHGIGHGLLLLVAAPILAALPDHVSQLMEALRMGVATSEPMLGLMAALIATALATTLVVRARYRLPIQDAGDGAIGLSLIPSGILAALCVTIVTHFLTQEARLLVRSSYPGFTDFPISMALVALALCPIVFVAAAIVFGLVLQDPADLAEAIQHKGGRDSDAPMVTFLWRKAVLASAMGGVILALFLELPELVALGLGLPTPMTGNQVILVMIIGLASLRPNGTAPP